MPNRIRAFLRIALAAGFLVLPARPVRAQIFESVGTRAQGMAGAFVAVADDATATWWNPAGLAGGAYFSVILEHGETTDPEHPASAGPADRNTSTSFAAVFPALGLSYYHLRVSEIGPFSSSNAPAGAVRQDQGPAEVALRSTTTSQFGVSIGQSIGGVLVVASTLRLVTAGAAAAVTPEAGGLLDKADDLETSTETHGDLDLGAMLMLSRHARAGITVKHVAEPSFGDGDSRVVLDRQARAGVALLAGQHGVLDNAILAFDADLDATDTATGGAKHLALGAEGWFYRRLFGLRGGVSKNRVGLEGRSTSAGASLAITRSRSISTYVDGAMTFGNDRSRDGWNVSVRLTF